jgi:hypothetical protein
MPAITGNYCMASLPLLTTNNNNMNIAELKNLITDTDGKMFNQFNRAKFLQKWRKHVVQDTDKLAVKQRWQKLLAANTRNSMVGIIVHNRCHVDHVNWSNTIITEANLVKFMHYMHVHDDIEVSRTYEIVTPDVADAHDGYERDLIMEAHEDGHAHVVYA